MARQNQETITYAFLTKSSNINYEGDYFYQYIFMDHKKKKVNSNTNIQQNKRNVDL